MALETEDTSGLVRVEGTRAWASDGTAGPWDPRMQHGGAPAALLTWAAEQIETPAPMRVARLTFDLMRPTPIGALDIDSRVIKQGRKTQLTEVTLSADGAVVVRGSALKLRTTDPAGEFAAYPPLDVPAPDLLEGGAFDHFGRKGFSTSFDIRSVDKQPPRGRGRVWFRQHRPLVEGAALSPAMRAAAVADYSNGISALYSFDEWTFLNGDLTINLAREPAGEWIFSDAETWCGDDGIGLASTRLGDASGYFGRATQTLIFERR